MRSRFRWTGLGLAGEDRDALLVEEAAERALAGGAVVADEYEQERIGELAGLPEEVYDPTDTGPAPARRPGLRGGATLQEAADDLVARVLMLVMAIRSGGIGPISSEVLLPNPALLGFLYELGDVAAAGGDIRGRLFG